MAPRYTDKFRHNAVRIAMACGFTRPYVADANEGPPSRLSGQDGTRNATHLRGAAPT